MGWLLLRVPEQRLPKDERNEIFRKFDEVLKPMGKNVASYKTEYAPGNEECHKDMTDDEVQKKLHNKEPWKDFLGDLKIKA